MRPQIAAHRRGGRLVEQGEPLLDLAGFDERSPLSAESEYLAVSVPDLLRQLVSLVEELDRFLEVALGEHRGECLRQHQPTVLRRGGLVGEQALRIREPAL